MDKDYLKKNNLNRVCRTFFGKTECCLVPKEVVRNADRLGESAQINELISQNLSSALLIPTLKYLQGQGNTVIIDVDDIHDGYLLNLILPKLRELKDHVFTAPTESDEDVYFFLYAGTIAYNSIIKSGYADRTMAYDPWTKKCLGIFLSPCHAVGDNQLLLGAIPKELLAKENFIPDFVQEIIDNQ